MHGIHSDEPSFRNLLLLKLANAAENVNAAINLAPRSRGIPQRVALRTRPGQVIAALETDQLYIAQVVLAQKIAAAARAALESDRPRRHAWNCLGPHARQTGPGVATPGSGPAMSGRGYAPRARDALLRPCGCSHGCASTPCGCGRVCANKSGGPTRPTLSHHGDEKRDSDRAYGSPRDGHVAALSLPLACTVFYSSASSVSPFFPATNARKFTHTVIAAESTAYTAAVAELYQDDCEKKLTGTGKRLIDLLGNPSEHCFVGKEG